MPKNKTVLVTGGGGYIRSVLCEMLLEKGHSVVCLDRFYFGKSAVTDLEKNTKFKSVQKDIRTLTKSDFKGVDVVMDLAGISNDPACDLDENLTENINFHGTLNVAKQAKAAGVDRYIFASSCSIYGHGSGEKLTEESEQNPVSLYAKSKIMSEQELIKLADDNFCVTFLRNATVYGVSPRMRFDLIINIMTKFALENNKIFVLGGGEQWRPIVHVRDVAQAFIEVMEASRKKVNREAFNVGSTEQNYKVIDVARMIQQELQDVEIEIVPDDPDKRTYNVSFEKIEKNLKFKAKHTPFDGIKEVAEAITSGKINPEDLRTSTVKYYKYLLEADKVLGEVKIEGQLF